METDKTGHWPSSRAFSPGQRCRWLRCSYSECGTKKPMTQQEVGDRVGIKVDPVTRLETEKQINGEYLSKICESLGIQKRLLTCSMDVWVEKVAILKSKPIVPMRPKKALP